MPDKIQMMCGARDCTQSYMASTGQGIDPSIYCSVACNRREAKHRKRDRKAGTTVPPAPTPQPAARPKPQAPVKKYSKRNVGSSLDTVGLCPRPYKMVFRTQGEAEAEIDRLGDDDMDVYRCKCGALHIGHPSPMDRARKARQEYKEWASTAS